MTLIPFYDVLIYKYFSALGRTSAEDGRWMDFIIIFSLKFLTREPRICATAIQAQGIV